MSTPKPTLAVWKFTSCDGCQLSLLDCEDELLALAEQLDIAYFLEASKKVANGPFSLSLVEGSITTEDEAKRIQWIRSQSTFLVTIGACATSGGIQALRNFAKVDDYARYVYPSPELISTLATSTGIAEHIKVDYELRGCPINKYQLLEVCRSYLLHKKPAIESVSVCVECKRQGNTCVMVAEGTPCLGPVTHAGCGAICPTYHRGCYGCYGPKETPQVKPLSEWIQHQLHHPKTQVLHLLRNYNCATPSFSEISKDYE